MKKFQSVVLALALALVATSCGSTEELVIVDDGADRNAALASDDGKPYLGMGCCIRDIAKDSTGNLWVGGDFRVVGNVTGGLAGLSESRSTFDRVNGLVTKTVADDRGGLYVGGYLASVGRTAVRNIARINADGTHDPSFVAGIQQQLPVQDFIVKGRGDAAVIYAIVVGGVVKLNAVTGALIGSLPLTFRGYPVSLGDTKIVGTSRGIVVAGAMSVDRGTSVAGAIVMTDDGVEVASMATSVRAANNERTLGSVLAVDSFTANGVDTVYIGGNFNLVKVAEVRNPDLMSLGDVGEGAVESVAKLTWENIGVRLKSTAVLRGGDVRTIDARPGLLGSEENFFGGSFQSVVLSDGVPVPAPYLAKVSYNGVLRQTSASVAEFAPNGPVSMFRVLDVNGSILHVAAGDFSQGILKGSNAVRTFDKFALALRSDDGISFIRPELGQEVADGAIRTASVLTNGKVVVGGDFNVIGVPIANLLKMSKDGEISGAMVDAWPNGPVNAIAIHNGGVFVGGNFDKVTGPGISVAVSGFVRYTERGNFDRTFVRPVTNGNGEVRINDIEVNENKVYVGGAFNSIAGQQRNNFATLDARTWWPLGGRAWESTDDEVTSIDVASGGTKVAIGGLFDKIGGFATPGVALIDEAAGAVDQQFRSGAGVNGVVSDVSFDDAGNSVYAAFLEGDSPLVNRGVNGTLIKRFADVGGKVARLDAAAGQLYVGLDSRAMRIVATDSNTYLPQPSSFVLGTTALLADEKGTWAAGRGFKVGANAVYGPVFISKAGQVVVNPSTLPPVAGADSLVTTQQEALTTPATDPTSNDVVPTDPGVSIAPDMTLQAQVVAQPTDSFVDISLSTGSGRVADGVGNEFSYSVSLDGTISLNRDDIGRFMSRTFMVTKLKPGNKSMTVTFTAPAGLKNVKIKAVPSGRSLVCSPGKKFSCTIKGLSAWSNYRFTVEGMYGKKKLTSPASFAAKPVVSMRRGATSSLSSIVSKASGSSPKYTASGGCTIVSKNTKLKAPKTNAYCSVTVTTTKGGMPVTRTVSVKVG